LAPQWSNAKELSLNEFIKLIPKWEAPEGSHFTITGDDGHAYGLYQITKIMVEDFNRITGNEVSHVVAFDPLFSARIAKTVLRHYSRQILEAGETPSTKHWLFIWNGGGGAWKRVTNPIRDQKQINLELYSRRAYNIIKQYKNEQTKYQSKKETQVGQRWSDRSWSEVLQFQNWF
jgi:hypothetical protein